MFQGYASTTNSLFQPKVTEVAILSAAGTLRVHRLVTGATN